mgnify:CR=1 FL=1
MVGEFIFDVPGIIIVRQGKFSTTVGAYAPPTATLQSLCCVALCCGRTGWVQK